MIRRLGILFALLLAAPAWADTSPSCSQMPNLVCATASDTVTGPLTLSGGTPLVFDGVTAGTNATTLTVTDPTGARTFTVPDANSVAIQPLTCSSTDKVSAVSAAGVVTCSADVSGGAPTWDAIASPVGSQALTMNATELTTWTWDNATTGSSDLFTIKDTTASTMTGHLVNINTVGTSTVKPIVVTAKGTANGIEMSNVGLLAKIGTGSIQADDVVCTTCIATTDIANNAVDGTKIAMGSDATGDLLYYGGTDYTRLAGSAGVLHSTGAAAPTWSAVVAADLTANTVTGAKISDSFHIWAETLTCASATCTALANTARNIAANRDALLVVQNGIVQKQVAAAPGANEFTASGTPQVLVFASTPGTVVAWYETDL